MLSAFKVGKSEGLKIDKFESAVLLEIDLICEEAAVIP